MATEGTDDVRESTRERPQIARHALDVPYGASSVPFAPSTQRQLSPCSDRRRREVPPRGLFAELVASRWFQKPLQPGAFGVRPRTPPTSCIFGPNRPCLEQKERRPGSCLGRRCLELQGRAAL